MTTPKRHHWWPEAHSQYWTASDGKIFAVRADGTFFRAAPKNVGLEGQLYTRHRADGARDLEIERWFASEIEAPFSEAMRNIVPIPTLSRRPILNRDRDNEKELKEIGFSLNGFIEWITCSEKTRAAITNYVSALIVRNPRYLSKIRDFHSNNSAIPSIAGVSENDVLNSLSLDNMLSVYETYHDRTALSDLILVVSENGREFLFPDGGISVREPWSGGPVPFDAFVPLTPTIGINILPAPFSSNRNIYVSQLNAKGVTRYNRNVLSQARHVVYCRSNPPFEFITRNFGVPAPAPFGHRMNNGKFETFYDRTRDK